MMDAESMRPYLDYWGAVAADNGEAKERALQVIRELPMEKRYISRVLFGLETALADCDAETIMLDLAHLAQASEIAQELRARSLQLALILDTVEESLARRGNS